MHSSITEQRIMDAVEDQMCSLNNPGFCINCGCDADSCEPDARNYHCDECGNDEVFGAQEVLLMM